MKLLPKHESLRYLFYWAVGIGIGLILFLPPAITFSFRAQILSLILAVLFIFTPWGNRRIPLDDAQPATAKRRPFLQCLGVTWGMQLTLMLAFYSICHLVGSTLPISIEPLPLFQLTLPILLFSWGLFPWGICLLLVIALSYTAYIKKQPGDMSTLLRPLLKNKAADTMSLVVDVSVKMAIALTLAFTLGLMTMECMGLAGNFFHLPLAYGMRLDVLLAMIIILQSNKGQFIEEKLQQILQRKIPATLVVAGFLLLSAISLLVISGLIGWLSPIWMPTFSRALNFAPSDWPMMWAIFCGIWWLGWTPMIAGILVYWWRGYKIHTVLILTLLLPVTTAVLTHIYPDWNTIIDVNTSLWNLLPAVLSIVCILILFMRAQSLNHVWKATLPASYHNYLRSPKTLLGRILKIIIAVMCLYWVGGIYIPTFIYFLIMYLPVIFIFTVTIAIFMIVRRVD